MNRPLRKAYYEYLDELARAGIVDHALNNAILEGKTVEGHVIEVLGAAGRLPEGWDGTSDQAPSISRRRIHPVPPQVREAVWLRHAPQARRRAGTPVSAVDV